MRAGQLSGWDDPAEHLRKSCQLAPGPTEPSEGVVLEPCIRVCHASACVRCGDAITSEVSDCTPDPTTMAAEWRLFCDDKSLIGLLGVAHYLGVLFGAIAGAALSERRGRREVCAYAEIFAGLATAACCFCGNYAQYAPLQFVLGFLGSVANVAGFTLAAELCGAKNRTFYSINLFSYGWATTCVITPLLGHIFADHLTGVVSDSPSFLSVFSAFPLTSPPLSLYFPPLFLYFPSMFLHFLSISFYFPPLSLYFPPLFLNFLFNCQWQGDWRTLQLVGGLIITAHGLMCDLHSKTHDFILDDFTPAKRCIL